MSEPVRSLCAGLSLLRDFPWGALSGVAATVGLLLTARAIVQAKRTRELQIFRDLFKDLLGLEKELLTASQQPMSSGAFRAWFVPFCQTLEYFAFLWNHRLLRDQRLTGYFEPAVARWYESVFLPLATLEEKTDAEVYPELKALGARLTAKKKSRPTGSMPELSPPP